MARASSFGTEYGILLQLSLTHETLAKSATKVAGAEHGYRPVLLQQTYNDHHDWKVWRLIEDFRFSGLEDEVQFLAIPGTSPLIPCQ